MNTAKPTSRHIFLAGLKHCGKTTLGKMLAARTGRLFYDLDDLLMDEARLDGYSSVRALYRTAGREKFQEYEAKAAKRVSMFIKGGTEGAVVSLGGGTIENQAAVPVVTSSGILIYLKVAEEVLFERIQKSGLPPFLQGTQPAEELFHELFLRRHPLYMEHADLILELPNQSVEDNFELLYSHLKDKNYVG